MIPIGFARVSTAYKPSRLFWTILKINSSNGLNDQKYQSINGNVKDALNIVTFNPDFEQMLITMAKKSSSEGLLIDPSLAKEMIQSIIEIGEKFSSDSNALVIVTSPIIRKDLSILLRQHIEDIVVLSFTELPENKRVRVIATVGEKITTQEKEKNNENAKK